MKTITQYILAILIVLAIYACDDSLGVDPDYKKTVIEKDTVFVYDTTVVRDTLWNSDSSEYKVIIDSLEIVSDSLGNVIDSLTRVINNSEKELMPRITVPVSGFSFEVTYTRFDSTFEETKELQGQFIPDSIKIKNQSVEIDTNFDVHSIWFEDLLVEQLPGLLDRTQSQQIHTLNFSATVDSLSVLDNETLSKNDNSQLSREYSSEIISLFSNSITNMVIEDVNVYCNNFKIQNNEIRGFTLNIRHHINKGNFQTDSTVNVYYLYKFDFNY